MVSVETKGEKKFDCVYDFYKLSELERKELIGQTIAEKNYLYFPVS